MLVNWMSKEQAIVNLSSTECEYAAIAVGSKEISFVGYLLIELAHVKPPTLIDDNSTGAIFLSRNKHEAHRYTLPFHPRESCRWNDSSCIRELCCKSVECVV